MKVVLIGSNGQLGVDIVRANNKFNYEIVQLNHNDIEIAHLDSAYRLLKELNPHAIINTAAFHKVDICENEVNKTFSVNTIGIRNLGVISEEINSKIIHLSTDYVFDGLKHDKSIGYIEFDKTNPLNVYGRSKLEGENILKSISNKYYILRTAWLYGTGGSKSKGGNFVTSMLRLAREREKIDVINDQIGTPTNTYYLANQILELIKYPYYGVYHATCEGSATWYEFALEIFKLTGINIKVNPISSEEFKTLAKRPKYSVLENYMLKLQGLNMMMDWRETLKEFITKTNMTR